MGGGEQAAIHPEREVVQRVHERHAAGGDAVTGDGDKAEKYPVADQDGDKERQFIAPPLADQIQGSDDEIADGNARKNSEETHGVQVEKREAVDQDAEQKQDDGASDNLQKQLLFGDAARESRSCGDDGGDSDNEEERGKDDIGWGAAVPFRVKQRPVG